MGSVNYYLKKAEPSTGKSLIYLQYKYNGLKLTYTFGQSIDPGIWNKFKQRVKSNNQTTVDGKHSLNALLNNLADILENAYNTELKNGIPVPATLKRYLDDFINKNKEEEKKGKDKPTIYGLIDRFVNNEIQHQGKEKVKGTLKKYTTVLNHLKDFEKKTKYRIAFETITLDFFYKYVNYLRTHKALMQNTIAKDIRVIKTFMNEAFDLGYTTNISHKHKKFSSPWVEVENVYLTEKEIIDLYNFDLSDKKKLEQVRDLFVFGCFTGLRFSDYSQIKPENIIVIDGQLFIKMITGKTGELVVIPCNPIILKIFEKYSHNFNRLPKSVSNQKFNEYIKKACEEAKMNQKGRLMSNPDLELCKCISSHTARRSFATNLYLDGYPTIEIMKITGHRTERAFMKYIKVTKVDAAKRLSTFIQKKWSEKLLKAVA